MEWYWWAIIICMIIGVAVYYQQKWKRERLMAKYGDGALVEKIMNGMYWQGQTEGQLLDSLGRPLDIDQKVLKTKTKEVWKYQETGKNRYALKIILVQSKAKHQGYQRFAYWLYLTHLPEHLVALLILQAEQCPQWLPLAESAYE